MNIIYSIIIPHKNIPQLLQRCLDSIPRRTDTEIIVIDDNSNANIVDFDSFPGADRANTKIIFDKSGLGAGHARNIGLKHATGEKILFADADDFYCEGFNDFLNDYSTDTSDIIYFNATSVDTNTYAVAHRSDELNRFISDYKADKKYGDIELRFLFGEPWSKLISRALIYKNDIKFDEIPIHNDTTFSYLVGYYAKKIRVDERKLYCITVRSGSTSVSITDAKILIRTSVFGRAELFLRKHGINTYSDYHYRQLLSDILSKNISLAKNEYTTLKKLGLTFTDIVIGCCNAIFNSIKKKIKKIFYNHI